MSNTCQNSVCTNQAASNSRLKMIIQHVQSELAWKMFSGQLNQPWLTTVNTIEAMVDDNWEFHFGFMMAEGGYVINKPIGEKTTQPVQITLDVHGKVDPRTTQ